jgi:hypothetical protein
VRAFLAQRTFEYLKASTSLEWLRRGVDIDRREPRSRAACLAEVSFMKSVGEPPVHSGDLKAQFRS